MTLMIINLKNIFLSLLIFVTIAIVDNKILFNETPTWFYIILGVGLSLLLPAISIHKVGKKDE